VNRSKLIYWAAAMLLAAVAGVLVYSMSNAGTGDSTPAARGAGSGLLVLLLLVMGAAGRRRRRGRDNRDG
jgi:MYXO-CTERM domain-containing protein